MLQKNKDNFRSMNCNDCQCNVCLGVCTACSVCYRVEFAEEDWDDFYFPFYNDDSCFKFFPTEFAEQ